MRRLLAFLGVVVLLATSSAAAAQGDLTDQELAYFDALQGDLDQFADITEEIGALFTDAGQTPALMFTQDWQLELAGQLVMWQDIADNAKTLRPSDRQQHIHDIWLDVTELTSLATDNIIAGVDNVDPNAMNQGTSRILYATALINELTPAIEAFAEDPNAPYRTQYALNPVTDCSAFRDYTMAQDYYAAWPEEQPTIDPDFDGLACEVHFGMG